MTTSAENRTPESSPSPESVEHYITPGIIVDDDVSDDYLRRIEEYDARMHADPDACLGSLARFVDGKLLPSEEAMKEQWGWLTDFHESLSYYFDGYTERAIAEGKRKNTLRGSADGTRLRALRLEIYLTRIKDARTLGQLALE